MRHLAIIFASLLVLTAVPATAASLYVAPGGSDTNSGTIDSPFATITKAASVARAGDVVNVRGGVYYEIVKIASRGTSSAPIVFRSYPGELAIIDGTGSASGTNLVQLNGTDWVDFSRFEVRNSTRIGIAGWGAKNTRIIDNLVHHSVKGGIWVGHSSFGTSYDLTISGNTVRNNVLENQSHATTGGWSQTIGVQRSDRVRVTGNRVFENDGEGIAVVLSDNVLVAGNEFFDNYSVQLYLDNAQHTTVDGNFVYSTGNSRYFRGGYPAHGIGTANETYSDTNPLSNLTITNNIVLWSRWGFFYGDYENGGGLRNSIVANNTFYEATHDVIYIAASTHTGTVIENNVFYQATGRNLATVAGSGVTYRANSWYGGSAGSASGSGDVAGDPRLVNPGGPLPADYRLRSDSPLVAKGVTTSATASDFWQQQRTVPYDIGAHEWSVGDGGASPEPPPADTTAPTAPSNLTATVNSSSSIALEWGESKDDTGVSGYRIFRDGAEVATVATTVWSDEGLAASTTYVYYVVAFDAAGNVSERSNEASATTAAAKGSRKRAVK
jgi:parallel beta-helix repeat protein